MNALDSPLEALAINYLSFGFLTAANNVWAWIAVITAAVSVWRIRASSSPRCKSLNRESSLFTSFPSLPSSSSSSEFERVRVAAEPAEVEVSVPSKSAAVSVFQTEGRTSGKFAVYYRDDEEVEAEEEEEELDCGNDENDDINGVSSELLGNGWEGTMKLRMNGMGWYHYQDLTVLDGNVVRLWEGCRRREMRPPRYQYHAAVHGGEGVEIISWKL